MNDNSKSDEYIDVAKNAAYQNQSKTYYNEFLNWRSSGNNPYAYSFVRRKSEHLYVDGKGFISKTPEETEQRVLKRCCRLIAMAMFTIILFNITEIIYSVTVNGSVSFSLSRVVYGMPLDSYNVSFMECAVICAVRTLKYLIPIFILMLDTKIPTAVMLPKADNKIQDLTACAIVMSLLVTVFCIYAGGLLAQVLDRIGVDAYRYDYVYSENIAATALFGVVQCVVVAVLNEVLFRGLILQTFRQFGDLFAFILCCIAETFSSFDISNIGFTACVGIIITLFTLRTGSIRIAIGMKISSSLLVFVLNVIEVYMPESYSYIVQSAICFIIIVVSLVIYARITTSRNFSFNIDASKTHLSIPRKLIIFMSNNSIMLWLIIVMSGSVFLI